MQEERKDYIVYDDGWQNISTPEYPSIADDYTEEQTDGEDNKKAEKHKTKKEKSSRQLVAGFQLILCILFALAGFILKSFGGEMYKTARDWYYSTLNNSVIYEGKDIRLDTNNLFGESTADEV